MDSLNIPKTSGIYKLFFLDPDLFYIGSTVNLHARFRVHRNHMRKGIHNNIHLQRTFDKYGEDALHFEIVEDVTRREDLIAREQYYLDTLHPHFNICKNAQSMLGMKHTEEAKEKNRIAHLGVAPPNKGVPMSAEQRQYFRDLYTGKPHGHKTNNGRPAWNRGIPPTPEMIANMRASTIRNGKLNVGNTLMTKEARAEAQQKRLVTMRNKTPEQKAEIQRKRLASRYGEGHDIVPFEWSIFHESCIECGTTTRRHMGRGLCYMCYNRACRRLP